MNSTSHELIVTEPSKSPRSQLSLAEQRKVLLQKIRTHRLVLQHRLGPEREEQETRAYPRSMIMRFLADRPGLATAVFSKLATFVIGARLFKSTGAAVAMAGVMKSLLSKR